MNAEEYAENITRGTDDNWTRMEVRLVARMAFDDGTATVSSETPLDLDARIVNEMRRAVLLDAADAIDLSPWLGMRSVVESAARRAARTWLRRRAANEREAR